MPAAAEIAFLLRLLADLNDLRMLRHARDEIVDLELAELMPEGEMLLRRQMLVMKEDDEVLEQRRADLGEGRVWQGSRQVDARNLSAERAGDPVDFDAAVGHLTALCHDRVAARRQHCTVLGEVPAHWPPPRASWRWPAPRCVG